MVPLSFEFFPPKTDEQRSQLSDAVEALQPLEPEYVSVTFGAGGSTLDYTRATVSHLRARGIDVAPHLSCLGGTRAEIAALLDSYKALGCTRLVALRGDLPSGMAVPGEFRYARDLVAFVRETSGGQFRIEVAAYPEFHPQAESAEHDLEHLIAKIRTGADGAITQYFYNADGYFRLRDDLIAAGIDVPLVPGIMPISNYTQLRRFSEVCGAEIPRWIARRLQSFGDDVAGLREFGGEVVAQLCRRLIAGGAPALHFYTLNRSAPTLRVIGQLG